MLTDMVLLRQPTTDGGWPGKHHSGINAEEQLDHIQAIGAHNLRASGVALTQRVQCQSNELFLAIQKESSPRRFLKPHINHSQPTQSIPTLTMSFYY